MMGLAGAFAVSLIVGKWFLAMILSPYQAAMKSLDIEMNLQAMEVPEPFMVYLKASLVLAALISSPWLFYQLWAFISAGLYKHERRFVKVVAPASALLFVTGVLFFLLVIAPFVFKFFVRFDTGVDYIVYQPQLTKTVNFIMVLALVFGLAFQTPIAIVFAERMGLVSVETLCRVRKYVFLGAFVVAAIATPPDVISQISLAVPLYILYESSIIVCRFWRHKRQPELEGRSQSLP
jgi:sec-independent protein translocase protein TatC